MLNKKETKLKELYSLVSKHSKYQSLPKRLSSVINTNDIEVKSRYESERLKYIFENVDINNKTVLDIGGNTGFFTFEMIDNGARKLHYYEGNSAHAEFVKISAEILKVEDKIKVTNDFFTFENCEHKSKYDIALLLNVLHHIGDDYGDNKISMEMAKETIIKQINMLSLMVDTLILQLGFNWKGNRDLCLFEKGTKKEMIDFIGSGTKNYWRIIKIGIAESRDGRIGYYDLNEKNVIKVPSLGEFLNRPIFIMKSIVSI